MLVNFEDDNLIGICVKSLKENKVIIAPSDTIYGFLAIVPGGREELIKIKGRDECKPFLQLASSVSMVEKYAAKRIPKAISDIWPAPLTVILDNTKDCTTAFRVPDNLFLFQLIEFIGVPLYSTSVNRSGFDPMHNINDISNEFSKEVALIVDNGILPFSEPSTLIDVRTTPYKIIRQGAVVV